MKELNLKTEVKDQTEEVRQKEVHEEKPKHVGTMKPHRGHTLFKYNTNTGELTRAEFVEQEADYSRVIEGKNPTKNKVVRAEEGCIYVSALNLKNAVKRLGKYHGVNVEIK